MDVEVIMIDTLIVIKIISGLAWIFPATLGVLPLWRLLTARAKYLDAIWVICLLGIINRWMFTSGWPGRELSYLAATGLAIMLGVTMRSYQREDHDA